MLPLGLSLEEIVDALVNFLPRLGLALAIYFAARLLSRGVTRILKQSMEKRERDPEVIVLLVMLTRWGIGFALQDVAKNFISGILLLLQEPFEIGDRIAVAGFEGEVLEITLRTTELLTPEGLNVLIPNADVYVKPIVNYSRDHRRRIEFEVEVSSADEFERLPGLLTSTLVDVPGVLTNPSPVINWKISSTSSNTLSIFIWADAGQIQPRELQNVVVERLHQRLSDAKLTSKITAKAVDMH